MKQGFTRREFLRTCAVGTAAVASGALTGCAVLHRGRPRVKPGPANFVFRLNQGWRFGGKFIPAALRPDFDDSAFADVTLPHCVSKLSWQGWQPSDWQDIWIYRRHFALPEQFRNRRIFLDFEGVMNTATPVINDQTLPQHAGGYLPFHYEITNWVRPDNNVLALAVDSRWNNVPPDGHPQGAAKVDYLEPGGIVRPVTLRAVPQIFISDVFARPVDVLSASRKIEVACAIDAAMTPGKKLHLRADLMYGARLVASVSKSLRLDRIGTSAVGLTLSNLGDVKLWHPDSPQLYEIVVTLMLGHRPLHDYHTRIGFREARFDVDGFFLNGERFRFLGLDRHEIFPYVGFAMPPRVMRRDAQMLRREFNCNIVRCSHYPQNEGFLDACDELGLMVWEETPGWQYLGDAAWKDRVVQNVEDMVRRDRNRPSVIIWGVRVNESRNDPELYQRTTAAAKALDDTRPASGSMTPDARKTWRQDWHEDVFAFDDYHSAPDGSVGIDPPLPGVPYMLAEAVGQFSYGGKGFNNRYRRAGDLALQTEQALYHAQAHNKAGDFSRMCGVIAWCAFDYSSLMNAYDSVKCPGIADVFRIPKLGAAFYRAQVSPAERPVILPNFYWDFGAQTPHGPGKNACIFSNCDRLDIFVGDKQIASVQPDRTNFPHLKYPPFFCDLEFSDAIAGARPDLRIEGHVGGKPAMTVSFSSNPDLDQFFLAADDTELTGDGVDATRLVFKVVDKYGADRAFASGEVNFKVTGPGVIVGDNPFGLLDTGGVGAVWVKTIENAAGQLVIKGRHSVWGEKTVTLNITSASSEQKI